MPVVSAFSRTMRVRLEPGKYPALSLVAPPQSVRFPVTDCAVWHSECWIPDWKGPMSGPRSGLTEILSLIITHAQRRHFAAKRPCRVLVVDDDFSARQYAERVFAEAGYVTSSAPDGPEALKRFENSGPFDVLVTDINMPQMDGAELARRIRSAKPSMKVLYLTGHSDTLFSGKPVLWNDEAFLEKPYTPDSLLEAVSLLLNGHVPPKKAVWG